jgi:hypothetical protein
VESAGKATAAALKVSNPSLLHLGSYARIAIHLSGFSPVQLMAHCTRNKIAYSAPAALRQLPGNSAQLSKRQGTGPRVEES